MRRFIFIAAGIAALATAGIAVANGVGPGHSVKSVSGTFAATTASKVTTRTCTTADNKTLAVSVGTYTGTAAGDPDLAGPITLRTRSTIDATDGVGFVTGALKIDVAGADTNALLNATYDHGKLAGIVAGGAHDPRVRLLGSFSAGFTAAGGFTDGKIGNSAGGAAVEIGPTKCVSTKGAKQQSSARGTVSAISDTSITVAGLTCSMSGDIAAKANAALDTGDRAEIHCVLDGTSNTLQSFKKHK